MADEITEDPDTVIESKSILNLLPEDDWVIYRDLKSKERWIINGRCNLCGLCEVGRAEPEPIVFDKLINIGEPNACTDISLKHRNYVPVRPDINESAKEQRDQMIQQGKKNVLVTGECTLTGKYL